MVVPYKEKEASKREQIEQMFDNISPKYDLLNRMLSLGIDIYWRKKALRMLKKDDPKLILDIATGTGDLAIEATKQLNPNKIMAVDISEGMLSFGRQKVSKLGLSDKIEFRTGDSENNTFDTVMVSFGVRNYENLLKGLTDMCRVTKQGGSCLILEFSKPKAFPIKQLYWFYNNTIVPIIGKLVSKDSSAYSYLPESVKVFPEGEDFLDVFKKAGFRDVKCIPFTFGICSVYLGRK
jgi:demethylmenaquinone methyltransferase / 2-methoxy-6-polyprenyl-1,4-benzoquinol methylase